MIRPPTFPPTMVRVSRDIRSQMKPIPLDKSLATLRAREARTLAAHPDNPANQSAERAHREDTLRARRLRHNEAAKAVAPGALAALRVTYAWVRDVLAPYLETRGDRFVPTTDVMVLLELPTERATCLGVPLANAIIDAMRALGWSWCVGQAPQPGSTTGQLFRVSGYRKGLPVFVPLRAATPAP